MRRRWAGDSWSKRTVGSSIGGRRYDCGEVPLDVSLTRAPTRFDLGDPLARQARGLCYLPCPEAVCDSVQTEVHAPNGCVLSHARDRCAWRCP
jgi:hypothetical protein